MDYALFRWITPFSEGSRHSPMAYALFRWMSPLSDGNNTKQFSNCSPACGKSSPYVSYPKHEDHLDPLRLRRSDFSSRGLKVQESLGKIQRSIIAGDWKDPKIRLRLSTVVSVSAPRVSTWPAEASAPLAASLLSGPLLFKIIRQHFKIPNTTFPIH